jgi:hypothetical protein
LGSELHGFSCLSLIELDYKDKKKLVKIKKILAAEFTDSWVRFTKIRKRNF